ncbi:MAG: gliding motility-associated C-terminal domain-containing protein, partial [Bacteroidales bacterium]|nr:gliding motility-associated C-terminal domain-containing protein [Bacteroidales bacterium]
EVKALPKAEITNADGAEICANTTFALQTDIANGDFVWSWTPTGYGSLDNPASQTPTYTPGATTTDRTVVFTLTVSNGACANATDTYVLAVKAQPTAQITNMPGGEICVAGANSTFQLQSTTSNGTLLWSHNGTGSLNNDKINNPIYTPGAADAGKTITITLTVENPDCPPVTDTYVLKCNQNPTANISLAAYCNNSYWTEDPITLSGNANSGTPAYSHKWTLNGTGATFSPNNTAAEPTLQFSIAQNNVSIYYEVTDSKGCKATDIETINVQALPKVDILGDMPLCMGKPGNYTLSKTDFPAGTRYLWDALIDGQAIMPTTETTTPAHTIDWYKTSYHAQIKVTIIPPSNTAMCTPIIASTTAEFAIYEKPYAIINGPLHVCEGDIVDYTLSTSGNQQATTSYTWSLTNKLGSLSTSKNNMQATIEWEYEGVEHINLNIQNGACNESSSIIVMVHPLPQPDFSYHPSEKVYFQSDKTYRYPDEIYPGKEVQFVNETAPYQTPLTYYWDFAGEGVFTETTNNVDENMYFTYDQAGDYTAQLHVVDNQWGCENTISKPIVVGNNPNCGLKFPNAFTPDKPDNNTFFAVYNEGVLEWGYELRIYDRWGALLWSSTDKSAQWNGYYKGELARQDVYVYHCKAVCEETDANGKHRELNIKGDVTIIR